jgi:RNase H-like domain found in reverse transcriptase/Reverse transcriptase (RNA-dependent DNA polymerase)/Chromo (CHRromatin Organisation MOdifier) domain/Integrase zinc binding domain
MISHRGLERSTVALMGFRNSPAYVQRYMDNLLKDHKHYCRAFIDDIVIFSDNENDHYSHLKTIFKLFNTLGISISPKKSFLAYPSVELLGFRVDAFGLSTTTERIAAFKNLEFPAQLKALEQYLGASGFLRHLLPYYAQISAPLHCRKTALLAKGRAEGRVVTGNPQRRQAYTRSTYYEPTAAEKASFDAIQNAICNETTLAHHDPDKSLFLQIDGSLERGFGVMVFHLKTDFRWEPGTVIPSNQVLPVMYLSRCLSSPELRYGPSELEVACLVWAAKKLRTMIQSSNKPVVVLTDHSATKGIVDQTTLNTTSTDRANKRLINSSIYLSQYGLQIYHLPGRLNFVPDALSRLQSVLDTTRPDEPVVLDTVWFASEALMSDEFKKRFLDGYKADKKYASILKDLRDDDEDVIDIFRPGHPFQLIGGLLYNISPDLTRRLCIPHILIKDILSLAHDEKHHFGRERMLKDLDNLSIHRKSYLVRKYVQHCPVCELNRTERQATIGDYEPIRTESIPMRNIAIDFIVGLPSVSALNTPWKIDSFDTFDALMTVSCRASKRTLLIPGNNKYSARDWATVMMRMILIADWGVPSTIVSDRDRKFQSEFWQGIWSVLGTKLLMTTAYHPQADGLSERKNQTVEIAIRYHYFCNPESNWVDVLPSLQWNLNNAYSEVIQASPHELLFGFKIQGPLESLTSIHTNSFDEIRFMREHLRRDAQLAADFAAAKAKQYYDQRHRQIEFNVGDEVYLRLHKGYYLPGHPPRKYSQQRHGPWKIKRRVGRLAYEIDLPDTMKIHPVISVAHLSPAAEGIDPFHRTPPPPGPLEEDDTDTDGEQGKLYLVEYVVKDRPHKKSKRKDAKEYLVKWKGWGHEWNQWKTERQLRHCKELIDEYWARKRRGQPSETRLKETTGAPVGDSVTNAEAPRRSKGERKGGN